MSLRDACAIMGLVLTSLSEWVGPFHVTRIERLKDETRFITGTCSVVDQCGLVFRPAPPTGASGKERLRPLSGNWYDLYDVF